MREFTLRQLTEVMRSCAGVDEDVDLDGDIADTEFGELGYDSLAVLELTGQIERRFGVALPEEAVARMPTPGKAVEFINARLAEAGV